MRPLPGSVCLVLALLQVIPACDRRAAVSVPGDSDLRPYDFAGHTALKLRRLCGRAPRLQSFQAARAHLRCGRTLLDWFVAATLREDPALLLALGRQVGLAKEALSSGLAAQILTRIAARFARAEEQGRGGSLSRAARAGRELVLLQRDHSTRWDQAYLSGLALAAAPGAAFEVQARMIIAGAALDGLKALRRAPREQRTRILIRGLGFSCPAEAAYASGPFDEPPRQPSCPLACPKLRQAVARLTPVRRKALIVAQCPLSYLGLSQREHGVYLSQRGLLLFRALHYQLVNLERLQSLGHSLVALLKPALRLLEKRLQATRVVLPLPDMSPSEKNAMQVPLCPSADEPIRAAAYLAIDETRFLGGPLPVLGVRAGRVEVLNPLEGYTFPGRDLHVTTAEGLGYSLAEMHAVWRRLTRGQLSAPPKRLAIYADRRLSAGRFNDLLDLLTRLGIKDVELVLRNRRGDLMGVAVTLARKLRSEGRPLPPGAAPQEQIPAERAPLRLTLGSHRLELTARQGPLAADPLRIASNDLAGVRERLEKTRRHYRQVRAVHVTVRGAVRYLEIARLLHTLRRNSSGRPLYRQLIL